MAEKALPVGGKRKAALAAAVQEALIGQTEAARQHSDRIVCITRFICAQYARTHGSKTIPVKDLPVIYAGAALHDMGHPGVADAEASGVANPEAEAALNALADRVDPGDG